MNEYTCIPVTICTSVFKQRPDEEAVVDQGGTSTALNVHYEKEELEGKRRPHMAGKAKALGRPEPSDMFFLAEGLCGENSYLPLPLSPCLK